MRSQLSRDQMNSVHFTFKLQLVFTPLQICHHENSIGTFLHICHSTCLHFGIRGEIQLMFWLGASSMAFCFLFRGCDKSSDQEMAWEAGASNGPSMLFCARVLKTEPLEAILQPSPSFVSLLRQPERKRKQKGRKQAFSRFFFSIHTIHKNKP